LEAFGPGIFAGPIFDGGQAFGEAVGDGLEGATVAEVKIGHESAEGARGLAGRGLKTGLAGRGEGGGSRRADGRWRMTASISHGCGLRCYRLGGKSIWILVVLIHIFVLRVFASLREPSFTTTFFPAVWLFHFA
jgi:hypothetical protein